MNNEYTEKVNEILGQIISDLSDNYRNDEQVLQDLLEDVISDALHCSNRHFKTDKADQLEILKSNIKKAVKTIYLQRGAEDVKSNSIAGESNTYDNAIETMKKDIISQNKRVMI